MRIERSKTGNSKFGVLFCWPLLTLEVVTKHRRSTIDLCDGPTLGLKPSQLLTRLSARSAYPFSIWEEP